MEKFTKKPFNGLVKHIYTELAKAMLKEALDYVVNNKQIIVQLGDIELRGIIEKNGETYKIEIQIEKTTGEENGEND